MVRLLALAGLVHLWFLLLPLFGGAGCCDQGGIDDRALLHGRAVELVVYLDYLTDQVFCNLVDLLANIVILQLLLERENRCLTRDPIADHFDCCESAHREHLEEFFLLIGLLISYRRLGRLTVISSRARCHASLCEHSLLCCGSVPACPR